MGDRTFYLVGGYQFVAPWNPAFEFHPAVSLMSNVSTYQMNLTGTVVYNNKFWGGVNYRPQESIGLMVGMTSCQNSPAMKHTSVPFQNTGRQIWMSGECVATNPL